MSAFRRITRSRWRWFRPKALSAFFRSSALFLSLSGSSFMRFQPFFCIPPLLGLLLFPCGAWAADASASAAWPAWVWLLLLLVTAFVIGLFGVMAGIGGGVLFVPLVSSFFPFHIDYVRGAGLFIALGSSLAATPYLLRQNLASLKLAMPVALVASVFSIVGAQLGLWLSGLDPRYVQGALGVTIIAIGAFMLGVPPNRQENLPELDSLAKQLGLFGQYRSDSGELADWTVFRTAKGLVGFIVVGLVAGMFGLGAGWANVPLINLVMGVPLKVAVATSNLSISIASPAAWVYLNQGAVLPALVAPSMLGVMSGSLIGSRLLPYVPTSVIRKMVIGVLFLSGLRSLLKGFGW